MGAAAGGGMRMRMKMRLLGGCRLRATGTQKREVDGGRREEAVNVKVKVNGEFR